MAKRKRYDAEEGLLLWEFIAARQREARRAIRTIDATMATPGADRANLPGQLRYWQQVLGYMSRCFQLITLQTDWGSMGLPPEGIGQHGAE